MRSATSAGSDGIRLINTKHTNEMIIRSGIADRIRFRYIVSFIFPLFLLSKIEISERNLILSLRKWKPCRSER